MVSYKALNTKNGLDFLVSDQHGGDVDTIHNVRQIGKDEQMHYKNKKNEETYNNKGNYDGVAYHRGGEFSAKETRGKRTVASYRKKYKR